VNYSVLFIYLAAMVGVGVYFANKNKNTDDYFRGGMQIPWWAAGCSIFATMLSSLTFTGLPSKAFAQDWVYAIGNFMIPVVAFVGVFIALPFYRRLERHQRLRVSGTAIQPPGADVRQRQFHLVPHLPHGGRDVADRIGIGRGHAADSRPVGVADGRVEHHLLHDGRHRSGDLDRHDPDVRLAGRSAGGAA
jgi:hypothetical protein